jgi:hypothetical protein
MSTFVPRRKPKNKPQPILDSAVRDVTRDIAFGIQGLVLAYDMYPDGHLTIRDTNGIVWEISIKRSDAKHLVCERKDFK